VKTTFILLGIILIVVAAGCETARENVPKDNAQSTQLQLQKQVDETKARNEQLENQLKVLGGLKVTPNEIYDLKQVKIGRYTNFYDKNKDGKKEKLIVYVQPVDKYDDAVKAAGAVDVELWNLNNKDGQALIGQWRVEPPELKKLWFSGMLGANYRLMFDMTDKMDTLQSPLTVKVVFTDYLTGKVFKEQKNIEF